MLSARERHLLASVSEYVFSHHLACPGCSRGGEEVSRLLGKLAAAEMENGSSRRFSPAFIDVLFNLKSQQDADVGLHNLTVVEMGSGWGFALDALISTKRQVSYESITAVEISPEFQEILLRRIPTLQDVRSVSCEATDAANAKHLSEGKGAPKMQLSGLDGKDLSSLFPAASSVDLLLAVNVVYFLDPLEDYAREMYRLLKGGGSGSKQGIGLLVCFNGCLGQPRHAFVNTNAAKIARVFESAGFAVEMDAHTLAMAGYTLVVLR